MPVPSRILTSSISLALLAIFTLVGHAETNPVWMLVGSQEMQRGAAKLIEHRRAGGFEVVMATPPVDAALAAAPQTPDYLLLLGDDAMDQPAGEEPWLRGKRHTLYRWRATQPETYVSDAVYGDVDGDGIPEIPVGRLPGRSPETIAKFSEKIVAFEGQPVTRESLHLPVWAGNPAYGDHFQANMASNLLRQTLHREAPDWADLTLIMGNEADPFSASPPRQTHLFHGLLARGGGLFTGLMGHGSREAFYSMPHGDAWIQYHTAHTPGIEDGNASAPAIIFACDCGNFAHAEPSLAEALLAAPGGPVAVIAATTQSHPLPNYYSSVAWLQGIEDEKSQRLGDLWTKSQRRGYSMRNPLVELFLKGIEGKLGAELDTPQIRKDHLLLYALLGDPATALKRPLPLEVKFTPRGTTLAWKVEQPPAGAKRLLLGHRLPPPPLKPKPENLPEDEAMALFARANAALQFNALDDLAPVSHWEGEVPLKRGTLRLVVETEKALYVATHITTASTEDHRPETGKVRAPRLDISE